MQKGWLADYLLPSTSGTSWLCGEVHSSLLRDAEETGRRLKNTENRIGGRKKEFLASVDGQFTPKTTAGSGRETSLTVGHTRVANTSVYAHIFR